VNGKAHNNWEGIMKMEHKAAVVLVGLSLLVTAPPALAQGKGHGKEHAQEDKGNKQQSGKAQKGKQNNVARGKVKNDDNGAGRDRAQAVKNVDRADKGPSSSSALRVDRKEGRGNAKRFKHVVTVNDVKPQWRRFAISQRAPERIFAGAASRGFARGLREDDIVIRQNGDRFALLNRSGIMLLDLDDERARKLGAWRVLPYDDDVKAGAPSFCRSGAGHPVFGRDWCLNKGFGLGDYRDLRWGRTTDVGDIIFRRQTDRGTLARSVLLDVLGDVVFNRLGLHALTLGYDDPLTGMWIGEPSGPRVLRLTSGAVPIAEIYDDDRDDRADVLVVALRPW
jgi:hypothetical protein